MDPTVPVNASETDKSNLSGTSGNRRIVKKVVSEKVNKPTEASTPS